jgi:coenzyme Q-binding protein COQ10
MTTIERSVLINATVDEVTSVAYDAKRMSEWYVGMTSAEPDGVYPEPGGQVDVVYQAAGATFKTKMTSQILERRGDGSAFMQDTLEGMIAGVSRWSYVPEGEGTRVTAAFDYEIPGGVLGKVADKLVVERVNAENLEKSLANLKAEVERNISR